MNKLLILFVLLIGFTLGFVVSSFRTERLLQDLENRAEQIEREIEKC